MWEKDRDMGTGDRILSSCRELESGKAERVCDSEDVLMVEYMFNHLLVEGLLKLPTLEECMSPLSDLCILGIVIAKLAEVSS